MILALTRITGKLCRIFRWNGPMSLGMTSRFSRMQRHWHGPAGCSTILLLLLLLLLRPRQEGGGAEEVGGAEGAEEEDVGGEEYGEDEGAEGGEGGEEVDEG